MENILVYGGTQNLDYSPDFKAYCFNYTEYASLEELYTAVNALVEAGTLPESFRMEKVSYTVTITADGVDVTSMYAETLTQALGEMKAYVGTTIDLTELATASTPEGYKLVESTLKGKITESGFEFILNYEQILETFNYADASASLDIKEYNGTDYSSTKTYGSFTSSVGAENYSYETSDANVATVANGVVTAVGNGSATITVKYNDKVLTTLTVNVTVWNAVDSVETFMAAGADANYFQVSDIDFGGAAVSAVAVNGVYDGQNYAIKNFVGKNVWGRVKGTVKNVKLSGTITCAKEQHSSGIVEVLNGTLENVYAEIKVMITGAEGWPYFWRGLTAGQLVSGYTARNIVLVVDDSESPFGYSYFSIDGDNPVDASTITMENILVYGGTLNLDYHPDFKAYCFIHRLKHGVYLVNGIRQLAVCLVRCLFPYLVRSHSQENRECQRKDYGRYNKHSGCETARDGAS